MPGISETLDCVYFFDEYLTEGLAIGEKLKRNII